MLTTRQLSLGFAIVVATAPAIAQSPDASLASLRHISPALVDGGQIFDRAAWSIVQSKDGRFAAFTSFDDTLRIYDTRSRTVRPIANAVAGASELSWSRRGHLISTVRPGENERAVYPWVIPIDTATGRASGPPRQLSMRPAVRLDDAPSFTPDDRFVVFASNRPDSGFVLAVSSNGGRERVIHAQAGAVSRATVSPDGNAVYFTARATPSSMSQSLYRVAFIGGRAQRLAQGVIFFAGVSADGSQLAWYADGHPRAGATSAIVIADAEGKPLGVVRDTEASIKSWSSKPGVLLGNRREFTFATRTVALMGGAVRTLGKPGGGEAPLAWSPDGKSILVASSAGRSSWVLMSATGDTIRRFVAPPVAITIGGDVPPVWSPDGKFVAYRAASEDGRRRASRVIVIDVATGASRTLREIGQVDALRWRSDSRAVQYVDARGERASLVETTLDGATTTLASQLWHQSTALPWPITDSTTLVTTRDSIYVVSARGAFVRTIHRGGRDRLSYLENELRASPDGRWVAVIGDSTPQTSKHTILLIPTNGDRPRTIAFDLDYMIEDPYFAGDALVFLGNALSRSAHHPADLFAIPMTGGVPRNLTAGDSFSDVDDIRISPDGRTVAYQAELGPITPTRLIEIDVRSAGKPTPNAKP